MIPFYIFHADHASYDPFDDGPFGNWDKWLNVLNIEIENSATEADLFVEFLGTAQIAKMGLAGDGSISQLRAEAARVVLPFVNSRDNGI